MIPVSVFIQILNMSLGAAWAAILVMAVRLVLRRLSHSYSYALWGVVLFRLVCPISFSSVLSLMPRPQTIPQGIIYAAQPQVESGFQFFDGAVSSVLPPATPYASANPVQIWLEIGNLLWQVGVAALLLYGLISYLHFLGKLRGAVLIEGNIWESDRIPTAFVLGLTRPKIYLPKGISESERRYILCHEQAHIRRLDHVVKPLALLLLAVHWFNPVLWVSYFLMRRDMEMSCDELALKQLGFDVRKEYSACLLSLSVRRSGLAVPLAFGESDVKSRILNVLRYKRPALWVSALAVALAAVLGFCLISDPGGEDQQIPPDASQDGEYRVGFMEFREGEPQDYIMVTKPEIGSRLASLLLDGVLLDQVPGAKPPVGDYLLINMGDPSTTYYVYEDQGYYMERPEDYRLALSQEIYREILTVWETVSRWEAPNVENGYYSGFQEVRNASPLDKYDSYRAETATWLAELLLSGTETDLPSGTDVLVLNDFLQIEIRDPENIYLLYRYQDKYLMTKAGDYTLELTQDAYDQIRSIYLAAAQEDIRGSALTFYAEGGMTEIAKVGIEQYYSAFLGERIPEELRLLSFTVNEITPKAGTLDEFLTSIRWDYDTLSTAYWISANGEGKKADDFDGWRWTDCYNEFRFRRVRENLYTIVGVGTGGGGQGLEPIQ